MPASPYRMARVQSRIKLMFIRDFLYHSGCPCTWHLSSLWNYPNLCGQVAAVLCYTVMSGRWRAIICTWSWIKAVFRYLGWFFRNFIRPPCWISGRRLHIGFNITDWFTDKSWILAQECHICWMWFVSSQHRLLLRWKIQSVSNVMCIITCFTR